MRLDGFLWSSGIGFALVAYLYYLWRITNQLERISDYLLSIAERVEMVETAIKRKGGEG